MTTTLLLLVLVAIGAAAFSVGRSLGERRGRLEARQDLERISRDAAGQSYEAAREACEKAAGQAVERLRGDAEQHGKAAAQSFAAVAAPLKQSLDEMKRKAEELGKERAADQGSMRQVATNLAHQVQEVQGSARSLRDAMRGDRQARGHWGEMQLENLIRIAGMREHCDFDRQKRTAHGNGIPDLSIHLPNEQHLAVDAKAPMDHYLAATEPGTAPEAQAGHLREHARALRQQVNDLAKRRYHEKMDGPPFTVMFLPVESLLAEAERQDPGLIRHALEKGVVPATPTTLLGILWSAAATWRDYNGRRNADAIRHEAVEVGARLEVFLEHLAKVGQNLERTTKSYNDAVGSSESRLIPQLRRLRDLDAAGSENAESTRKMPAPVDTVPRRLFPDRDLPLEVAPAPADTIHSFPATRGPIPALAEEEPARIAD